MTIVRVLPIVLAVSACAPQTEYALVAETRAQTYLFVALDSANVPLAIEALPGDAAPLWTTLPRSSRGWLLAFDRPFEELGAISGQPGAVPLLTPSAPLDEAWPLPEPKTWWVVGGESETLVERAEIDLSSIRVPRPPCAATPVARTAPITGTGQPVVDAVRVPGGAVATLAAVAPSNGIPPMPSTAYRLVDAPEPSWVPYVTSANRTSAGDIFAFEDDAGSWLIWPRSGATHWDIVSASDERAAPTAFEIPADLGQFKITAVVGARIDGVRKALARGVQFEESMTGFNLIATRFVLFDLDTGQVRTVFDALPPPSCNNGISSVALELTATGDGYAGYEGGPLLRFDLATGLGRPPFAEPNPICRSAFARLASGTEVITYQTPAPELVLAWKPPGGDWNRVPSLGTGAVALAVGEQLFVSGSAGSIEVYDYAPSRPELPPRVCHSIPTAGITPYTLVAIAPNRILVGGLEGQTSILELQ